MSNNRTLQRIQKHINDLADPNADIGMRAVSYLTRYYGSKAFDQLSVAAQHTDPNVRYRVAIALAETKDERAYEVILRLARDPDASVRFEAAIALGVLGDERAIPVLVEIISTPDPLHGLEQAAAMGLEHLGTTAKSTLVSLLQDTKPDVRAISARILGRIGGDDTVEPIIAQLKVEQDEDAKIAMIESLAEIGTPPCISAIQAHLSDSSLDVQRTAHYWYQVLTTTANKN